MQIQPVQLLTFLTKVAEETHSFKDREFQNVGTPNDDNSNKNNNNNGNEKNNGKKSIGIIK